MENNIEDKILDAAINVFLENGFEATNMKLIAEAASIGRPSLYYYYKTKEEIFGKVISRLMSGLVPKVMDLLSGDISPEQKIVCLVDIYFTQLSSNPKLPLFLIREMNRDMSYLKDGAVTLSLRKYFEGLISFYDSEVEKGTLRRVPLYAIMFTLFGSTVIPFLTQPLVEEIFVKGDYGLPGRESSYKDIMDIWKPYIADSMKRLLLVR